MGFLTDADLRRPAQDPCESRPVGTMAGQFQGRATLLVREPDGAWDYGDEIGIDVVPNAWFEFPLDDARTLYWSGIEVTLKIKDLRNKLGRPADRKAEQYFIVAALEPAGWGWSACAPLRGENHHLTTGERNEEIR